MKIGSRVKQITGAGVGNVYTVIATWKDFIQIRTSHYPQWEHRDHFEEVSDEGTTAES